MRRAGRSGPALNLSPSCCTGEVIYNSLVHYVSEKRPTVLCQLCYRTSVLFPSLFVCLDLQITSAWRSTWHLLLLPRGKRRLSGLERNPKDKNKEKKKQKHHPSADYTLTFWKKSSPPLTLPSEAARAKQRETEKINKFTKTTQSTQFLYTQCNKITRRLLGLLWKVNVSHSERETLRWISISLDVVVGTATDVAHLPERNKNVPKSFSHNPGDWTQLPSDKLMDTLKIFGHFTVTVNGALHTKRRLTLLKFVFHFQAVGAKCMKELQNKQPRNHM